MKRILVSYFSASGVTQKVAFKIAEVLQGDLFEIEPQIPYTKEDLDWTNNESRSTLEMQDKASRPVIKKKVDSIEDYDTVLIGFPIWWYTAPTIINTFIEENDLSGKDLYVFATSGSSDISKSLQDLKDTYPNLHFIRGKRFLSSVSEEEIYNWFNEK